jgi:hypothetical protein
MQRVKFSRLCESCENDCLQLETNGKCEYFKLGFTMQEYWQMIREENMNIRKFCDKNRISMNHLLDMLNDKMPMCYKYRTLLNERLAEKEEYVKWLEDNNVG